MPASPARVVVTRLLPGGAVDRINVGRDTWVWGEDRPIPRDVLTDRVGTADGLLCMLTDTIDIELLDAAPNLRVISCMAVGVDNIDLGACADRGIPVGHTPGVLTETTADTAFALLMAGARRLVEGVDHVKDGQWGPWDPELLLGHDIHTTTLGIVGMGRIGKAVARRALGFGMRVIYHNRSKDAQAESDLGAGYRQFDALLADADHVVLSLPLNSDTHHIISGEQLNLMKSTATLVNVGRGSLVDAAALYEALRDGVIASAALDVTDPEPISVDDPLLTVPNCIVIPHLGSASHRTRLAMADLAIDNLLAGLDGERLTEEASR